MFLFIQVKNVQGNNTNTIQIHLMFLFIFISPSRLISSYNSNTSHVLIYHFLVCPTPFHYLFKYISCSYLSIHHTSFVVFITQFKYISCSYLSSWFLTKQILTRNSNTSHVLIYQQFKCAMAEKKIYSNTSHVLIYQSGMRWKLLPPCHSNTSHVLIYPRHGIFLIHVVIQFKYISCSYLSEKAFPLSIPD